MKKWIYSLTSAGLLALSLSITGCGGGDDDEDDSIVGVWRLTSLTANGQTSNCPGAACGEQTYRFLANNTYEVNTLQNNRRFFASGTWSMNVNSLTTTATRSGSDTNSNGVVEANEISTVAGNPITVFAVVQNNQLNLSDATNSIYRFERQ